MYIDFISDPIVVSMGNSYGCAKQLTTVQSISMAEVCVQIHQGCQIGSGTYVSASKRLLLECFDKDSYFVTENLVWLKGNHHHI